ncbi:MAG: AraC family transcriptional regulator [Oscillospiraceae bacterium]|nr:AraC family transcriptional regulator [Oscillospiraceae bacterium]
MSRAYQIRLSPDLQDLNPILAGSSIRSTENSHAPYALNYTLIHYVTEGSGTFCVKGKEYPVRTGQAFLMLPGETASFTTGSEDPWSLRWIGFNGKLAHQFSALPPVFDIPSEVFAIMCDLSDPDAPNNVRGYRIAAELMLLYSLLLDPTKQKPDYVQLVMDHIDSFYMQKISVAELATSLGLNRCYLSGLFKKRVGFSIQEYLLKTRLEASKRYLLHGSTIKEAATLSGFTDVSNFSKLFTRDCGANPTVFRKRALESAASFQKNRPE